MACWHRNRIPMKIETAILIFLKMQVNKTTSLTIVHWIGILIHFRLSNYQQIFRKCLSKVAKSNSVKVNFHRKSPKKAPSLPP